ncbi:DUF5590 domain-containing protein [Ammoniphilus sp. 3BR4]|uniref:cell wall elongation regulator TseB-like domain-containing protein n=1 Tax=Ammoniphilus sp. 3BR4 TaxID=3158265 RepID=UPI003467CDB8
MRNWLIVLSFLLLLAVWQSGHLLYSVLGDKSKWEEEGTVLAKSYTEIEQVEKVSQYHGKASYIVVQGRNAADQPITAWFRDGLFEGAEYDKDLMTAENIQEKVSKQVKVKEWIRLQPGMEDRRPLWEAVLRDEDNKFNYYYYDMKSGQFIRSYRLQKASS